MKIDEKIISIIDRNNFHANNFGSLIAILSKELGVSINVIAKSLNKLIKDGVLSEDKNGKVSMVKKKSKLLTGTIAGTSKAYAFIRCDGLNDLFVPAAKLYGALDGDKVLFKIVKGDEAEVIKILEKSNSKIVGIVEEFKGQYFVVPKNSKISKKVLIPKRDIGEAKAGDVVAIKITFQPSSKDLPAGKVLEVFKGSQNDVIEQTIRFNYQISETFPQEVESECLKFSDVLSESDKADRLDLTNEKIFTIDGADAKDLDDAVSITKIENGYKLGVHIADVGNYVKHNSKLDEEAYFRGTSVYFPNIVFPMLPKKLSNNLCSLNPSEEKLTLSVIMELDFDANVKKYEIKESVIKSVARFTYDEVYDVLCGKKVLKCEDVKNDIILMGELSKKIENKRISSGALDLDLPETYFELDENNEIISIKKRDRNDAHKLIENFMVLCNEVVAKHCCKKQFPFVYRIHEKPTKEKIETVVEQLAFLGMEKLKTPKEIEPKFVQEVLNKLKSKDYAETGNKLILRSLQKARYADVCLGHFGLALEFYSHFTSPIRRYPDLVIHRIIKKGILNEQGVYSDEKLREFVIDASERSSQREKNADEAERTYDDYLKAKYMSKFIGCEFEGRISGLTEFGIFVMLENTIEGMIKVDTLSDDEYVYDDKKLLLKSRKRSFALGQKLKIRVAGADISQGKVEFELINS